MVPSPPTQHSLSPPRCRLLSQMQQLNFGRIENLSIVDSEPTLSPCSVFVREHKFGGDNGARPELDLSDFLLKQQVVELFECFDKLQNGAIDVLEVKHGLPFRMITKEAST
jgi:hypothetical protein